MPLIISANRLGDGIVVYLGHDGAWREDFDDAKIFVGKADADPAFALARRDAMHNLVVEPCLVEVAQDEGGLFPVTLRERIRAQGPTIDFLPPARCVQVGIASATARTPMQAKEPDNRHEHNRDDQELISAAASASGVLP